MSSRLSNQRLLLILADGPCNISALVASLGVSGETVRDVLRRLEAEGKVVSERGTSSNNRPCLIYRLSGKRRRAATPSVRPCLCCGNSFVSEGAHNRLCYRCRELSGSISPYALAP